MARALLLAIILVLGGCQTVYLGNENSPYFVVPAGSILVLQQSLTIPAFDAGVYIQGGQVMPLSEVHKYDPHCRFEVLTVGNAPQTVAPDTFVIEKAVQEVNDMLVDAGRLRLAATSAGAILSGGDDGPSVQTYVTRMTLRSRTQPNVYRLSCGQWAYPGPWGQHVTINEMRRTLGNLFTLHLAPTAR